MHCSNWNSMPTAVADKLHIGLSTVITHRKNIMDKLGLKSVSALTILFGCLGGYFFLRE